MTIVAAWTRRTSQEAEELVVASDSRLTGGMRWDCGPKIFPMARGDAVLAFAGHSYYAYPLIMQLLHWSEDYSRAKNRSMDLCEMKGHMERACTKLLQEVDLSGFKPPIDLTEDFHILLGGYSWLQSQFFVWTSKIDKQRHLAFHRNRHAHAGVAFVGDQIKDAKRHFAETRKVIGRRPLDWEPLDIVVKMIQDEHATSIGGPPQLVKVYRHMNTMMYAVPWRVGDRECLTLRGRPLLDYEQTQRLVHDTKTHRQFETWNFNQQHSNASAAQQADGADRPHFTQRIRT